MRALVLHDLTGPEALRLEDLPEPEAPGGTVAVEAHAAGIGFRRLAGDPRRVPDPPAAAVRAGVPDVLRALGERLLSGKAVAMLR